MDVKSILAGKLSPAGLEKLMAIENPTAHAFVADAIELCRPESVFVCTDSPEDIAYIRQLAIQKGEEIPLKTEGHTIHFDGPKDQARDKDRTRYLVTPDMDLGESLNDMPREQGLPEVRGFLKGAMEGHQMLVRFFCLAPTGGPFSISGLQITDSAYVGHSEDLLYRPGYEQFKTIGDSPEFFRFLHSAGRLENNVSADVDKRRVYIDLKTDTVYSSNTQYAGNTVGFKKLALRLAIRRADREGWLAEHMFVMGAHGPNGRITYFSGAFPSACGKTSTAMINGETIIGDDLAYLRKIGGKMRMVNVESGIFGIIRDVTADSDPVIWEALTSPGEVIFSNVLNADGVPYWLNDGRETPETGVNFQGDWHKGMTDASGKEVPCAHPNARYTVRLTDLTNMDPNAEAPGGVPVGGIIYGGRDSDTWVPVRESFNWQHGVITMAASLESETTSATLGKEGVRAFQPMSNMDFVSMPLGRYINNHLAFPQDLDAVPPIFAVNYFIRGEDGKYLTGMNDKNVWLKWMERRANGELAAIETPIGLIPCYEDLAGLFRTVLDKEYSQDAYVKQFTIRVPENLAKIDRIENIYRTKVADAPQVLFDELNAERERLLAAQREHGDYIPPTAF